MILLTWFVSAFFTVLLVFALVVAMGIDGIPKKPVGFSKAVSKKVRRERRAKYNRRVFCKKFIKIKESTGAAPLTKEELLREVYFLTKANKKLTTGLARVRDGAETTRRESRKARRQQRDVCASRHVDAYETQRPPKCNDTKFHAMEGTLRRVGKKFKLSEGEVNQFWTQYVQQFAQSPTDEDKDRIFDVLLGLRRTMDNLSLSESSMGRVLAQLARPGVTAQALGRLRKSMDAALLKTFECKDSAKTSYLSPKDVILQSIIYSGMLNEEKYFVLFSGDGRVVGSHTRVSSVFLALRLVYLHAKEKDPLYPAQPLFPLCIVEDSESYTVLEAELGPLLTEMEEIARSGITLPGGRNAKVEFVFCADKKFTHLMMGLQSPKFACTRCFADEPERKANHREHPVDTPVPLVTFPTERQSNCPDERGRPRRNLISFIPTTHILEDTLHLCTRICDRLTHICCEVLIRKCASGSPEEGYPAFLNEQLGPVFAKWTHLAAVTFEMKQGRWATKPSITGNRWRMLLEHCDFASIPCLHSDDLIPYGIALQKLFKGFFDIFHIVNSRFPFRSDADAKKSCANLHDKIRMWCSTAINGADDIVALTKGEIIFTPYIHSLVHHVHEMLLYWGDIGSCSAQGLEFENGKHGSLWYKASCRRDGSARKPVLLNSLRRLYNVGDLVEDFPCDCGHVFRGMKTLRNHAMKEHMTVVDEEHVHEQSKKRRVQRETQKEVSDEVTTMAKENFKNYTDEYNNEAAMRRAASLLNEGSDEDL